jgi:hypothetical protein
MSHQERIRKAYGEPCIDCFTNECSERGTCACVCHEAQAVPSVEWRSRHCYDADGRLIIPWPPRERVVPQADGDSTL